MGRWLALLSAVNVGGTGKVPMADLRDAATAAGLREPRTLLASGNLVFESDEAEAARVEAAVEAILLDSFDLKRRVLVRSAERWRTALAANPMSDEAQAQPGYFHLMALGSAPEGDVETRLVAAVVAPERVEVRGDHAYAWWPNGAGRAATDPKKLARALGVSATARNWNTALRLMAMLEA